MSTPPFEPPGPPQPDPQEPAGSGWGSDPTPSESQQGGYAPPPTSPYQPYGSPPGAGDQTPYGQQPYGTPGYSQQPYGQQPYGQPAWSQAYPVPTVQPTNGMAIASLVVSIAGLLLCCGLPSVVGAVLGHMARGQIRSGRGSGDGLALSGIIVGWIAFAIGLCVAAFYIVGFIAIGSSDY